MKHLKLIFALGVSASFLFASCSNEPKLLTEAEITKKVAEATAAKTKEAEAKLDQECTANMEALTNAAVDSILTANAVAK